MASPNAGPITGSELLVALQGNQRVHLTRPQVAQLLALQSQPSDRPFAVPTSFLGTERIAAIQGGQRITLSGADLATYLAATGVPDPVHPSRQPTTLVGIERVLGVQDGSRVAFSIAETLAVRDGGSPPTPSPTLGALTVSPNTSTVGTPYSGTVSGKTAGSTLSLTGAGASGLSVSGSTITGTPTASGAVNVVETLAGATNSPNPSNGVLTVDAAAAAARLASSRLVMAQQAVSNNTDGNSNTRISFYNASGATITHGQFLYSTARLNTANEGAAAGPLTVTASHEATGGAISRMGGGASVTVPNTGDALVLGPEIALASPTAPGEQAYARTYVVAPGSVVFPQNYTPKYTGATSLGEMQDFATGVDKTDGSAITNVVPGANKLSYGPIAFIATKWSGTPNAIAYVGIGDSLIAGSKDKDEAGSVSQGNIGYTGKALAGVAPYAQMAIGGAVASSQPGNMSRRLAALALMKPTHIMLGYGTNDLLAGRTAAQIAADVSSIAGAIKTAVPGVEIIVPTLMPDTTSSDFFATASGQTITASPAGAYTGGANSERSKYNAMVRAGLTNVDYFFDAADLVEVDANNNLTRDGGYWRSGNNGTGTGYNSTYLGTTGATAAATDDGRHPWMSTITGVGKGAICILRDALRTKVQANWA